MKSVAGAFVGAIAGLFYLSFLTAPVGVILGIILCGLIGSNVDNKLGAVLGGGGSLAAVLLLIWVS